MRGGEFVEQKVGQKERSEQIDLKGAFEAVLGQFALLLRAARVVRQNVDPIVGVQFPGEPHDVGEPRVVREVVRHAEFARDPGGLLGVAPDEDHVVSRLDERTRRGGADAVAAPGDDDGFSAFVFHKNSFIPCPRKEGAVGKITDFQAGGSFVLSFAPFPL